jgi:hypothetical protein
VNTGNYIRFPKKKIGNLKLYDTINILGGSLVTTAWRVLRLRMEETPSSYGGSCECTECHGEPIRGGPPALGLGVGLTTPHNKKILLRTFKRGLGLKRFPWINDLSERKWT